MNLQACLPEMGERFGLDTPQLGVALAGGEWNEVYRLEAVGGSYVLRIAHPSTSREALAYSHGVMVGLHPHVPEVVSPLRCRDGETWVTLGERLLSLFPWVDGDRGTLADPAFRTNAARLLAKVHRSGQSGDWAVHPALSPLREMEWRSHSWWDWPRVSALLDGDARCLEDARPVARQSLVAFVGLLEREGLDLIAASREFEGWLMALRRLTLATGLIHGDYYAGNLLQADGVIIGLIDWDDARPEWLIHEVARATWEFCRTGETLNAEWAERFLRDYLDAGGPVGDVDLRHLIGFMRYTRLEDALFGLTAALRGGEWDDEHSRYHLENLRAMVSLKDHPPLYC